MKLENIKISKNYKTLQNKEWLKIKENGYYQKRINCRKIKNHNYGPKGREFESSSARKTL